MQYSQSSLVRIAKRENNAKRGYLVVDPVQAKHMAVSPTAALNLFEILASKLINKYNNEKSLVVGFAETATAIGAQVAISLNSHYIQTTREIIDDVDYLFFSEAHSHATEQKLVKDDIDIIISKVDRIIFVEDEVTTGNTIINIISLLRKTYKKTLNFTILSLLNGMDAEAIERSKDERIDLYYLVKTDHSSFEEKAEVFESDGQYIGPNLEPNEGILIEVPGCINTRRLTNPQLYHQACENMSNDVIQKLYLQPDENILVLGTEEFMYPALYLGRKLEEMGHFVRSHATTRSPIVVSKAMDYPLHTRYELESLYDNRRKTFIYDIGAYDRVVIVTDSKLLYKSSLNTLINAVKNVNSSVFVIRWY